MKSLTHTSRLYLCNLQIVLQNWSDYMEVINKGIMEGSAVMRLAYLIFDDDGIRWYRGKERLAGFNPFASFMMNKKWWLEEEFNNHMLRFQQVPELLDCFLG